MKPRLKKIYLYRHTLWDMSVRQFKLSFAGLRLGIWWTFITPALLALSINFVFNEVLKMNMRNFTLFVLCGLMPWSFLTTSLQEAVTCLNGNLPIIRQGVFPRELIPVSIVIANLLNFIIGFILFIPLFIIFNPQVAKVIFFLPVIILLQSFFILGLGLLFSSLNIFFKDLSKLLPVIFMVWFWTTPVFYSLGMLSPHYRWVCMFNPATHYIISYQNILFDAKTPSLPTLMFSLFFAAISLAGGAIFFIKNEPMLLKKL